MGPTEAEVARTLLRGRLPGTLQIAGGPETDRFRHATGVAGRPLVLARDENNLLPALPGDQREHPPTVQLSVVDAPPSTEAPSLGRARIMGRLHRIGKDAKAAVLEFAESNPVTELFDVGRCASIYAIEIDHVSLERRGISNKINPAEYATAEPDPLHEIERDLLADLADHHAAQIERFFRQILAAAKIESWTAPRPVRLDRYGFIVDLGAPHNTQQDKRWARLEFARPVQNHHDLAHLLHPVLFHPHHPLRRHN